MAFSFTLPELRAELRALGHDGLPDHVILSFLSQLNLPLPSPASPSYSSGYDTEASTCSTHSLSCEYGSLKECTPPGGNTAGALEGCADRLSPSSRAGKALSKPGDRGPDDHASCAKSLSLPETNCAADSGDSRSHAMTACRLGDGFFGGESMARRRSSSELHSKNHKPPSSVSMERHQTVNRETDAGITLNEKNVAKSLEFARGDLGESRHMTLGHTCDTHPLTIPGSCKTGPKTGRSHHAKRTVHGKQGNTDNIIEHYWMSVGEEHMRAIHSKISQKEQLKEPSVFESHRDVNASIYGCNESKTECESLIAKVQRCENELQCLTLSLRAQQCKKPWFLEAARKPRVFLKEKCDIRSKGTSLSVSEPLPVSDSAETNVEGCGEPSPQGQSSMITGNNVEVIPDANENAFGNPCSSSLEHANDGFEDENEIPTSEESGLSKVDEADTTEANFAVVFSAGDIEEVCQIEDTQNKLLADVAPDQNHEPDHSVCSKSSSASYQHSRSSGDSRSNGSQQLSTRSSTRKRHQLKKRGGKIDRVARFAEMQKLWKKDTFLAANEAGRKRKGVQSFHHLFSSLHSSGTY